MWRLGDCSSPEIPLILLCRPCTLIAQSATEVLRKKRSSQTNIDLVAVSEITVQVHTAQSKIPVGVHTILFFITITQQKQQQCDPGDDNIVSVAVPVIKCGNSPGSLHALALDLPMRIPDVTTTIRPMAPATYRPVVVSKRGAGDGAAAGRSAADAL